MADKKEKKELEVKETEETKGLSDFERLYQTDVSKWTEKKKTGSTELTYLSWANMVRLMTNEDPDWEYKILEFNDAGELVEYGHPFRKTIGGGYEVRTRITFKGKTKEMWLPILDNNNAPMRDEGYNIKYKNYTAYVAPVNSAALNTSQMRCLVKNAAMFGLGLYIYAGEDLPSNNAPVGVTLDADSETGEIKTNTQTKKEVNADTMNDGEALTHTFEEGPEVDGTYPLKDKQAIKLITESKDAALSIKWLKKGSESGTEKDKKTCQILLKMLDEGTIQFNEEG